MRRAALLLSLIALAATGCETGGPQPLIRPAAQAAPPAGGAYEEGKRALTEQRPAAALAAFRRAVLGEGRSLRLLNGLAIAYAELGRDDLAARYFGEAQAQAEDDPLTLNNIGYAALKRGETELARRYFTAARAAGAEPALITANLTRLAELETARGLASLADQRPLALAEPAWQVLRQTEREQLLLGTGRGQRLAEPAVPLPSLKPRGAKRSRPANPWVFTLASVSRSDLIQPAARPGHVTM